MLFIMAVKSIIFSLKIFVIRIVRIHSEKLTEYCEFVINRKISSQNGVPDIDWIGIYFDLDIRVKSRKNMYFITNIIVR